MDNPNNLTGWTSEQWGAINQAVTNEVNNVSVAGSFLPCYGPLSSSAEVVRRQDVSHENATDEHPGYILVDDVETLKFWTASVFVSLKQQQMAQANLDDALLAFRRAANLLARAEDAVVFNGLPNSRPTREQLTAKNVPAQINVTGHEEAIGLYRAGRKGKPTKAEDVPEPYGQSLVTAIAKSIGRLEKEGHLGPFACIMGIDAYTAAYTPDTNSMVLPSDRIQPMLGTTILRSGTLAPGKVIVVSLAGDPMDLVVATSPTVQFLHLTEEAHYVFRVYERFALRIKEKLAVDSFKLIEKISHTPNSNTLESSDSNITDRDEAVDLADVPDPGTTQDAGTSEPPDRDSDQ